MPVVKGSLSKKAVESSPQRYSIPASGSFIGVTRGVGMSLSLSSMDGNDTYGVRHYVYGLTKETNDGSPTSPCLKLEYAGSFWRFRWVLKPGQRRISVRVKQMTKTGFLRPTMIIRPNPNVGITSILTATAPDGDDWTVIGPLILTATGTDMVYVEIWNNCQSTNCPLYIDRIVAT
jgi:hypothetical protein